ncbi:4-hydroxythreonine-4-phosphate dehydrogenase PdxA [Candidatus Methylacidiphilum infernorum]|uniref:4-hydroxythreonine-4-phosphate dehydrogenase PdxA n=1 Tax=Candidatus Methylacidiphilum infernorum TaxID=511746 RepID=A0ABX7PTC0_9BACT|nr:4-hydroxythreonine-4-phosphate dehydrogenase PdxA [Candidatus Methylacidiphilum infernorum]QSR86220.1 4-hydroxythreonine-4-phosphate dehydrogenase PdxA [Candidatus Methylacidiphilum infernorum]
MRIPTIGITLGEPAGIGPEIVAKALKSTQIPKRFDYKVIGPKAKFEAGKLSSSSAAAAWEALEEAYKLWEKKEIQAIVTSPVHKDNLFQIGFPYPGQTEFFAAKAGVPQDKVVMAMSSPKINLSLLSTHVSLYQAIKSITKDKIKLASVLLLEFLKKIKKKPNLSIAISGLNPHCGEGGNFGNEENETFIPAINELRNQGLPVYGPVSPDSVFREVLLGKYDGVVASYHDQGLIPFKLVSFYSGVNVTLGLPLIRTSPDHGVALDIAGQNKADPRSLISAIKLACKLIPREKGG